MSIESDARDRAIIVYETSIMPLLFKDYPSKEVHDVIVAAIQAQVSDAAKLAFMRGYERGEKDTKDRIIKKAGARKAKQDGA